MQRFTYFVFVLLLIFVFPAAAQDGNSTDACVTDYDESVDYFPHKAEVQYAEGFTVEYHNNYKVVELIPWVGAEETFIYVLVQCGTPAPEAIEADAVIEVPVDSMVSLSTTFLPHMEAQGVLDRLVGVDSLMFTSNEAVLARANEIAEVGGEFTGLNTEILLETQPDLIMVQQFSSAGTALDTIQSTGLQVVLNADFADTSPLGQAEWGKYIALYFNTEAEANAAFDTVATEYETLAELTADIAEEDRPTVIAASPFQGSWFMPAGDSYLAQMIADAGGNFVFADEAGTSISLSFETVLEEGSAADYWVNFNQFWLTTDDMLADDPRYAEFASFQSGNLWNNNLRVNGNGGNDYFEAGVANPHLLLADLIAIFHPDLLPDHEFQFYQPLESSE
jgi:iron complex transport system substrate-binding protein